MTKLVTVIETKVDAKHEMTYGNMYQAEETAQTNRVYKFLKLKQKKSVWYIN